MSRFRPDDGDVERQASDAGFPLDGVHLGRSAHGPRGLGNDLWAAGILFVNEDPSLSDPDGGWCPQWHRRIRNGQISAGRDRVVRLTYREHILATAENQDDARMLARRLPRPSAVRQQDDGQWAVVQLLPARWEPTRSNVVEGQLVPSGGGSRRRAFG